MLVYWGKYGEATTITAMYKISEWHQYYVTNDEHTSTTSLLLYDIILRCALCCQCDAEIKVGIGTAIR